MRNIFCLFLFFLFQSCAPNRPTEMIPEEAEMKIYHEWLYTFRIQDIQTSGEIITRPPGVEQLIFRLVIPTEGGVSLKTHCVYYQVPYKKIDGLLKIIEYKNDSNCREASGGNEWLVVQSLSDLKIKFENFKLNIEFKYKKQNKKWFFLLPNVDNGVVHDKFQMTKEKKLYSGLTFLRINEESFDNGHNKYLGNLNDRMASASAIRCEYIDKNCKTIGENRCDSCKYGWYEVVDYNCPQGGSKFCGQNHCGEKNEPACVRGVKIADGLDSGICQDDLTAVYSVEHILICQ